MSDANDWKQRTARVMRGLLPTTIAIGLAAWSLSGAADDDAARARVQLGRQTMAQRKEYVQSLDKDQLYELKQKFDRFQQLSDAEQQRIRELHGAIQASPHREKLERALQQYTDWLKTLPSGQRAELLSKPGPEQFAEIKRRLEEQSDNRLAMGTPLTPLDLQRIRRWIFSLVSKHEEELLRLAPTMMKRQFLNANSTRKTFMLGSLLTRGKEPLQRLSNAEIELLVKSLSERAQQELGKAKDERAVLASWMRLAIMPQMRQATQTPSITELRRFYNTLPADEKKHLETLEPAQSREALLLRYRAAKSQGQPRFDRQFRGQGAGQRPMSMRSLAPQSGAAGRQPTRKYDGESLRKILP